MRIRKNASKLILGSATSIYSSSIESLPNPFDAAPEAEEAICELNCSPWDVMLFDCSDSFSFFDGSAASLEEEEDGGSLGSVVKTEMEPISSSIPSTAAELTLKEMKEIESQKVGKKTKMKKSGSGSKGKEVAAAETATIQYCKKSDGKGWRCKRPALPHSRLCSYHLAQCRSYSSHPIHKSPADSSSLAAAGNIYDNGSKNRRAREEASANLYYYYGGFGPSRGKRRGRSTDVDVNDACDGSASGGNIHDAKVEEEAEKDECVDVENVAGDDGHDIDRLDKDNGGNYCGVQQGVVEADDEIKEEEGEEKKKRKKKKVLKKRGRKPIKARSLKSLL